MYEFEIYEAGNLIAHFILFHMTVLLNANILLIRRVLRLSSRGRGDRELGVA